MKDKTLIRAKVTEATGFVKAGSIVDLSVLGNGFWMMEKVNGRGTFPKVRMIHVDQFIRENL